MSRLTEVERVIVPRSVVEEVLNHLRLVGKSGLEGVALWAGKADGRYFEVVKAIIPRQTALKLPTGLVYFVEDDELHRINVTLFKEGLTLIAQLHSHPGDAFHSETDDAYPMMTEVGGISIVVPHFAREDLGQMAWAVYRLKKTGWNALDRDASDDLIEIWEA